VLLRVWWSDTLAGWAFISPTVLLIGLFGLVPVVWAFVLSFEQNDLISPGKWVGLDNYRKLLHDPAFSNSVRNTVVYTLVFVPVCVIGSLLVAALLNRRVRGITFYRVAVFIPVVTSTVATATMFNWLLDPDFGVVNAALNRVGIASQGFFRDPKEALLAIVLMTVWGWLGFGVIIYLAALQSVPADLLEAAAIDGCTRWRAVLAGRGAAARAGHPVPRDLADHQLAAALRRDLRDDQGRSGRDRRPLSSITSTCSAFQFFNGGYASAIAYALFMAILVITAIQLKVGRRLSHGER